MRLSPYLTIGCLVVAALLNMGTIRKKFDPIAETRTDPISYEKKMEELKDGEKGAPTPSFKFYDKEDFLTEPPHYKEDTDAEDYWTGDSIPEYGAPIPEDVRDLQQQEKQMDQWWEEESPREEKYEWEDEWEDFW